MLKDGSLRKVPAGQRSHVLRAGLKKRPLAQAQKLSGGGVGLRQAQSLPRKSWTLSLTCGVRVLGLGL